MARGTSTRSKAKTTPDTETATEAATPEAKEAPEMTTTVEPTDTEATEAATEATAAEGTAEEKSDEPEFDLTAFDAAVKAALETVDPATGHTADEAAEAVRKAYRDLDGVKAKNAAKKSLNEMLRDIVSGGDIVKAQGVMHLVDVVANAGSAPKAQAERKPADPREAYIERLALHHLAYNLVSADLPDGVNEEEAKGAAQDKVNDLTDQADKLFAWTQADEDTRGDEPEVSPLVKKAVRLALGKVSAGRTSGGTSTPHDGPRGNTARHIQLVFKDHPVGTFMKVAEIAKLNSEEYPDRKVSAGAINARLKSNNPIPGIELASVDGKAGARKTADVEV